MTRRRTLTKALAETHALKASRAAGESRALRTKHAAQAPQEPSTTLYSGVMSSLTDYAEKLTLRVPWASLTPQELDQRLRELELQLLYKVNRLGPAVAAQGRRTATHARAEVQRLLNVNLPKELGGRDRFYSSNMTLLRRMVTAQMRVLRTKLQVDQGADIEAALWVLRHRSQLIAKDQTWKFQAHEIERWSTYLGYDGYFYLTCRDERVRRSHRPHDGKTFRWAFPPDTGHPGTGPSCRCKAIPVLV